MKTRVSILALILTLPLLLGALAGCMETPDQPEQTTAGQTTEQATEKEDAAPKPTIEESESGATVTTGAELCYTVTGYDSVKNEAFCFVQGLMLDFGDTFAGEFNRFTLKYTSTAPLKLTVSYTEKDNQLDDIFYLEAGEHEFSAVNKKFLSKVNGSAIASMRVDTCENKSADFILLDMKTEIISVPKTQQFIQGSRYTLGIDLRWGGAINHVEDKECPMEDVTNMCNKHDEGRLIQQSYYGVFYRANEYVEGGYLGVEGVAYNPVQGGDGRGRDSRIIDFIIEDDYIYVKAQPLDWPMNNSLTPSYMENKYVVKDEYIEVFNRFTDFSGWTHPVLDQELPAVYTVNCFDTFVWYDGGKPWTGDALSTITDWSNVDPNTNKSSHYIQLKEPNTETWFAMINGEAQYGLGIYVPNVDRVLTMRYLSGQKGSNDAKGNPCSYISPLNRIAFKSFEPIEYSYLMVAGNLEEIREVFTQNRDFNTNEGFNIKAPARAPYSDAASPVVVDLSVKDGMSSINYPRSTEHGFDEEQKAIMFKAVDADPNVTFVFDYGGQQHFAEDHGIIEIEYMIPTTNAEASYETQLFLCAGDIKAPAAEAAVTGTLIADGQYHTLQINVKDLDFWQGLIHMVRFDYFSSPTAGDTVYVKAFRLTN